MGKLEANAHAAEAENDLGRSRGCHWGLKDLTTCLEDARVTCLAQRVTVNIDAIVDVQLSFHKFKPRAPVD